MWKLYQWKYLKAEGMSTDVFKKWEPIYEKCNALDKIHDVCNIN